MDDPRAPADTSIPLTVAQLVAVLERLDDALLIQHRSGAIAFVNDAAARLCGFDTAAAMRAVPIDAVLRRFTLHDATGHRLPLTDLPARRVLAGEPVAETTVRWRSVATGEERWSAVRATAVPDAAGQPAYVLSVFRDITDLVREQTERERREAEAGFLAEATAALAASLDYDATLNQVARLTVPALADWCVVYLREGDTGVRIVAIAHADPAKVGLLRELVHLLPLSLTDDAPVARALRLGESSLVPDATRTRLHTLPADSRAYDLLRILAPRSAMVVPLTLHGAAFGSLSFIASESGRRFGSRDLAVAEELGRRAAIAVENARLYRETQAAEERYRALFAGVGDAVLVTDAAGRYIDANPAMVEMLGYTVEELRRMRVGELTAGVPSDFAREIHTLPDGSRRGEMELCRKDGTVIPVEGWVTSVDLPTGRLFLGTWRDISARRAAEEERQQFIAMIAHELRNPLSSLIGYAELMRRRERFEPRAVGTIIAQGKRLERLTLDLRDAMRIGSGTPPIHRGLVDARALIADAVEQAQTTTTAHAITLTMPDALPPARWDADRIAQVLGNLLLNAIKYSVDGDVRVRVEDRGDHVRVAVTDTGIGIPPEALRAIFAPFYRAANAREGSARGMGLGLPISKALVEAHGGAMWAESTLGQGSTFIFTLPYLPPDDASDTAQPSGM